jgi:peptidylprolyl isomerase
VKLEYEGKLEDGTVFDSSERHGKPLEFVIGTDQIIPGFEKAVMRMQKGEEKTFKLKPPEAYGEHNPQLVQKFPRDRLPKGDEPKPGMLLVLTLPDGNQLPAKITGVEKDWITIDLNHPLAGKTLTFKIKLVEIRAA